MSQTQYVSADTLDAGLRRICESPKAEGVLEMIVRRPGVELRETAEEAVLNETLGLVGDNWLERGSSRTPDKKANPHAQLTLMNSRAIALIAGSAERWPLAGDQLYADLDLSGSNLPAGSRLRVGEAVIEISAEPHTGCAKFKARYGGDAVAFVNSPAGRANRLRGVNARIVSGGKIRVGDRVVKL
jgi:MOSC domain-containing protein YiiM